jgi:signal peptidase II
VRSPIARATALGLLVTAIDQATKALVRSSLERGEEDPILPGVTLVNTRNRGVAFGFLEDAGAIVTVVTVVALSALVGFFWFHRKRPLAWLPTGLLLGGAAGNLIDRAREGAVTDFVDLPAWPAFNFADVAITFGVLALLYVLEGPPRKQEADDAGG